MQVQYRTYVTMEKNGRLDRCLVKLPWILLNWQAQHNLTAAIYIDRF